MWRRLSAASLGDVESAGRCEGAGARGRPSPGLGLISPRFCLGDRPYQLKREPGREPGRLESVCGPAAPTSARTQSGGGSTLGGNRRAPNPETFHRPRCAPQGTPLSRLLPVVWHVLTKQVADREAVPEKVAGKFLKWSWKLARVNRGGLDSGTFIRRELRRIGRKHHGHLSRKTDVSDSASGGR